jgi:hypothetical protein
MAVSTLEKLADAVLGMVAVMENWKVQLEQIHERIQDIELAMQANAIDPEEFRRLRLDVADIERRTRETQG